MVKKATMESKTKATLWVRNRCQKWSYILFVVTFKKTNSATCCTDQQWLWTNWNDLVFPPKQTDILKLILSKVFFAQKMKCGTHVFIISKRDIFNDNHELHCFTSKWLLLLCYENMNYHNCYLILVSIDNILKYCIIDENQKWTHL